MTLRAGVHVPTCLLVGEEVELLLLVAEVMVEVMVVVVEADIRCLCL